MPLGKFYITKFLQLTRVSCQNQLTNVLRSKSSSLSLLGNIVPLVFKKLPCRRPFYGCTVDIFLLECERSPRASSAVI